MLYFFFLSLMRVLINETILFFLLSKRSKLFMCGLFFKIVAVCGITITSNKAEGYNSFIALINGVIRITSPINAVWMIKILFGAN